MKTQIKQKRELQFNVIFRPEKEGGFTALVPALSGCITYGRTLGEARRMAADAIEGYVVSLRKHRELIPSDEETFISSVRLPEKKSLIYA